MKIGFVVNPYAGVKKNAYNEVRDLTEKIYKRQHTVEIIPTKEPGDATQIAKHFADNNFDVVAAVGGDGTSNETARGLISTETAFSIIPYGSGNGLARGLSISLNRHKAVEMLAKGRTRMIDVGEVTDGSQRRFFFGFAGTGFDAHIGSLINQKKGRRGFLTYLRLSLGAYRSFVPVPMRVKLNEQEIFTRPFILAVANTGEYGNNARIAPGAVPDDGFFEICLIQNMTLLRGLAHGWRLFNGTIDQLTETSLFRSRQVDVEPETAIQYHLDGEPYQTDNVLRFRILPKYLKVIV